MPLSSHRSDRTQDLHGSCLGLGVASGKSGFVTPLMASDRHRGGKEGRKEDDCQFSWLLGSVEGGKVCLGVEMEGNICVAQPLLLGARVEQLHPLIRASND